MANKKIKVLEFRRVDFGLLVILAGRMLCEAALKCRGTQEIWLISKGIFLKAQELSPYTRKQADIAGGRFEQRTSDLILKEVERGWTAKEQYRDIAWACMDGIGKAEACQKMEIDACDWE